MIIWLQTPTLGSCHNPVNMLATSFKETYYYKAPLQTPNDPCARKLRYCVDCPIRWLRQAALQG